MAQSTNTKSKPLEGLYTDTDPDNRSKIITDITIRVPGKAGTMMMEVKVDPEPQPSCIPLHKFKTLFPHLCRDGLPKEGLLDNNQNEFQSYNGADMTCYRHFLIDVRDKVRKKYHPIRFYVMSTDVPRTLISHAASYWLSLVRVLAMKNLANVPPHLQRMLLEIRCHHQVLARTADAVGQCFEQMPSESLPRDQTGYASRLHCLHEAMD